MATSLPLKAGFTSSFGAFNELFQYTYADAIIKLLDSVDDVEKWIDSVNFEDWDGGDAKHYLYKTSEGSGSRFLNGGPGSSAPILPKYNPPAYSEAAIKLFPHMDVVESTGGERRARIPQIPLRLNPMVLTPVRLG